MLKEYSDSIKDHNGTLFSDDKLYAVAGWLYVNGASPDTINFEHPPLGKYLIGLSELVFMNEDLLNLAFSSITLLFVYLISRKIIHIFPFVLFPTLILSLDRLYIQFSSISMLDIYATFFAVLSVYLMVFNNRKWATPLLYVTVGLALSCKWTTIFLLVLLPICYVLRGQRHHLKNYPFYLTITVLTYVSSYAVFFLAGNTITDFLSLQHRMITFHQYMRSQQGAPPPLWILLNFLLGIEGPTQIQTLWFNPRNMTATISAPITGLSLISTYNPLTWPISFSASILALCYLIREKRGMSPIPLAFLISVALVSTGKPFIWYLLPSMPFAFISLAYMTNRIYEKTSCGYVAKIILASYLVSIAAWSLFVELPPYIIT